MRKSLKVRLICLFTLFACLPVIIASLMNGYFSIEELKNAAFRANFSLNQEVSNEVSRSMNYAQDLNAVFAAMPTMKTMQSDLIKQTITDLQKQNPQFELIAVLDENGQQIARSSGKNGMRADRDYFKKAIKGDRFFSDAYISATTQSLCVTVSTPIKDNSGKVIGVVASDVSLAYLWEIADALKIGQAGYIDIVDSHGTVLAHPNKDKIKDKENFSNISYIKEAIAGNEGKVEADSTMGEKSLVTYVPINGYGWGIITYEPLSEVYATAISNGFAVLIILVLFMIISSCVAMWVTKSIVEPITELGNIAHKVSCGDLSQVIQVDSSTEINKLAGEFNLMVKHLRSLILKTTETSETVSAASQQLAASIEAVGTSAQEVSRTASQVAQQTSEQVKISGTAVTVIREITESIETAAATAQSVSIISEESRQVADEGAVQSDEAIHKIINVQQGVKDSAKVIDSLGEKSRQIGQIIDTISSIAGQTNLLALNAAIEAARAGEHGRGFAVVAEEVRKLADQSGQATREIAEIIHAIRTETMLAVEKMELGCQEVDSGVVSVQKAVDSFGNIQGSVSNVNDQIANILQLSLEQKNGSENMQRAITAIADVLEKNAKDVERVASVSADQSIAVQEVKEAAADLANMAMELRAEISKFSV